MPFRIYRGLHILQLKLFCQTRWLLLFQSGINSGATAGLSSSVASSGISRTSALLDKPAVAPIIGPTLKNDEHYGSYIVIRRPFRSQSSLLATALGILFKCSVDYLFDSSCFARVGHGGQFLWIAIPTCRPAT